MTSIDFHLLSVKTDCSVEESKLALEEEMVKAFPMETSYWLWTHAPNVWRPIIDCLMYNLIVSQNALQGLMDEKEASDLAFEGHAREQLAKNYREDHFEVC